MAGGKRVRLNKFQKQLKAYNAYIPPKDTLFDEIQAFWEQQKDNAKDIKELGCLEYRMWGFIERIVKRRGK